MLLQPLPPPSGGGLVAGPVPGRGVLPGADGPPGAEGAPGLPLPEDEPVIPPVHATKPIEAATRQSPRPSRKKQDMSLLQAASLRVMGRK
jgi:hypothetical protein